MPQTLTTTTTVGDSPWTPFWDDDDVEKAYTSVRPRRQGNKRESFQQFIRKLIRRIEPIWRNTTEKNEETPV